MREPIEKDDIRAGDKVRVEFVTHNQVSTVSSLEYTARCDGMGMTGRLNKWCARDVSYYLLDRPAPAVDLPTDLAHIIGWLTAPSANVSDDCLGEWFFDGEVVKSSGIDPIAYDKVTSFVEAVAVPKAALDELRQVFMDTPGVPLTVSAGRVAAFLAAVDAANGGDQ